LPEAPPDDPSGLSVVDDKVETPGDCNCDGCGLAIPECVRSRGAYDGQEKFKLGRIESGNCHQRGERVQRMFVAGKSDIGGRVPLYL
jgi:hypothetical protein